jgi:hypothetical protein
MKQVSSPPPSILLLDDKRYGMAQIKNALPSDGDFCLDYCERVSDFRQSDSCYDIVFLDYYLDLDGVTGDTVVGDIKPRAKLIIGFSSVDSGNCKILSAGADYAVLKQFGDKNEQLENLLLEILG